MWLGRLAILNLVLQLERTLRGRPDDCLSGEQTDQSHQKNFFSNRLCTVKVTTLDYRTP